MSENTKPESVSVEMVEVGKDTSKQGEQSLPYMKGDM